MTRKLYIKTHGCQMNEYDSAKMADVLRAAHGPVSYTHLDVYKRQVVIAADGVAYLKVDRHTLDEATLRGFAADVDV